ncbi:hypothetical protein C8P64_1522 [Christiangramia gaetbulicola]|uniref:Uncharacterized protein n=1 Tax=Christiangramia gaetbulicola TaxID=703340 RepID=A0A2T6AGN8_9FLAO|nr:hypothetical protein C8P64_1522 [Christiangramia gaetbulicola]
MEILQALLSVRTKSISNLYLRLGIIYPNSSRSGFAGLDSYIRFLVSNLKSFFERDRFTVFLKAFNFYLEGSDDIRGEKFKFIC